MENFGLGILLNFQDNASSGIDRVMGALESLRSHIEEMNQSAAGSTAHLSAMASSLGVIGTLATGVGVAVTGAFGSIIHSVATTGAEFERTKIAMGQLYGSAEEGRKRMIANMRMSATTPFDMEKFNTLATQMKSINIEADKQLSVVDKFGKRHTQTIAEYVGDLAAMRPDKRFEDASREIIEFLEGNARPLKMSFGLDIPKLLGEGIGETAEERLDQYIRAIAQRAYVGTMQGLNGSWDNIFSNLGDHVKWFVFYVTESGIFEQIKKPFYDLNEYLTELMSDESAMKQLGQAVSDALGMIVAPAIAVFNVLMRLSGAFIEFTKEHPRIVSMGVAFVGLGGQILAVGGAIALFTALWLKFRVAVLGGMTLIAYLRNGLTLLRVQVLALARSVLPLTITLGLLYVAWQRNLLGIRTFVGGGLQYLANVISIVIDALTHMDIVNKRFSLSKENNNLAEKMGLIPFIQNIVVAGHYVLWFFEGLKNGIGVALDKIDALGNRMDAFFRSLQGTVFGRLANEILGVGEAAEQTDGSFQSLVNTKLQWTAQGIGTAIGKWGVYILAGLAGIKLFSIAVSGVTSAVGILTSAWRGLSSIVTWLGAHGINWTNISTGLQRVGTFLGGNLVPALTRVGNVLQWAGRQMMAFAVSPTLYLQALRSSIVSVFTSIGSSITGFIGPAVSAISGAFTWISTHISSVITFITTRWTMLTSFIASNGGIWGSLVSIFNTIRTALQGIFNVGRLLQGVFNFGRIIAMANPVGLAITAIGLAIFLVIKYWDEFKAAAEAVWAHVQNTVSNVIARLQPLWERIKAAVQSLAEKFPVLGQVFEYVGEIISGIWDFITGKSETGSAIMSAIFNALGTVISVAFDLIMMVVEIAVNYIGTVIETLVGVLEGIITFIEGVFTGKWETAWEGIKKIFTSIWDGIKGIAKGTMDAISGFIDNILGKASDASSDIDNLNAKAAEQPVKKFGKGGIVTGPTIALIAEEGNPEVVIPINSSQRSLDLLGYAMDALGVKGKDNQTHIDVTRNISNFRQIGVNVMPPNVETAMPDFSGVLSQGFNSIANVIGSGVSAIAGVFAGNGNESAPVSVPDVFTTVLPPSVSLPAFEVPDFIGEFVDRLDLLPERIYEAVSSAVRGVSFNGEIIATPSPVVSTVPQRISVEQVESTVRRPAPVASVTQETRDSNSGSFNMTFQEGSIQFNVTGGNFNADEMARQLMPRLRRAAEIEFMQKRGR